MKPDAEGKLLLLSLVIELFFGLIGVALALKAHSHAVFLDGSYSLICTLTMAATMRVAYLIKLPPSEQYPFSRAPLEPFLLVCESLVLIGLCLALVWKSLNALMFGGEQPNYSLVLGYEVLSVVIGGGMTVLTGFMGKQLNSPLLKFESQEWLLDTGLSLVSLISFFTAVLYAHNADILRLTDPVLTLFLCIPLLFFPCNTIRNSVKQLLWCKAPPLIQKKVEDAVSSCQAVNQVSEMTPAALLMGRTIWIKLFVQPGSRHLSSYGADKQTYIFFRNVEKALHDNLQGYQFFITPILPDSKENPLE